MQFLTILRPVNLLLLAVIQYVVYTFVVLGGYAGDPSALLPPRAFAALAGMTVCAAAAGYIINDFYDIPADTINKPGRNIIGTRISANTGWLLLTVIAIGGVVCAYVVTAHTGKNLLMLYGIVLILLWLYSALLQRLPLIGNLIVSVFCALAVYLPWYVQSPEVQLAQWEKAGVVGFFTVFAFLITLIREVIKDLEDFEGDRTVSGKTLPAVIGEHRTRLTALFVIVLTVVVSGYWLVVEGRFFPLFSQIYFILLICAPLLYIAWQTHHAQNKEAFSRISQYLKLLMFSGTLYLIFI